MVFYEAPIEHVTIRLSKLDIPTALSVSDTLYTCVAPSAKMIIRARIWAKSGFISPFLVRGLDMDKSVAENWRWMGNIDFQLNHVPYCATQPSSLQFREQTS